MKYSIVYDRGRVLRVRCGDYAFTKTQGYGISAELSALPYVESAEANFRSGSILVTYAKGSRKDVLRYISRLDRRHLPEAEVPALAAADDKFKSDLCGIVGRKILMRFLPLPVRNVITAVKALKYVIKGLDSFLRMDIAVDILDGTAIGVSVLRKDFGTASSVMFLLSLSELLEDYTRQRAKLALTEQLALNIDNVWKVTEGEPVSVPFSSIDVEQIKRNTEKHNQTSRNILNTYAFIHTINVDFTLFMQNSITVLCGAVLLFQSSVM